MPSGAVQDCGQPKGFLQAQCQSIRLPYTVKKPGATPADGTSEALTAADLQSAYGLDGTNGAAATRGTGETVAIVNAYGDPNIMSDLATYRSTEGLNACDATTGAGCLSVYDEHGGTNLPAPNSDDPYWEDETALDAEMVSAICPNCHIDLFEANSFGMSDLGTAENTAAAKDKFVSNSWSFRLHRDYPGESEYDSYFNHPGVAIAFASGIYGYGQYGNEAAYPASSQYVTSVGGTYLTGGGANPWSQYVWNDANGATGSGCSAGEAKPAWETDTGCAHRTQNDVSAVADSPKGIAVYSTDAGGWEPLAGTSVATPIITAMYALAGTPAANSYPVNYLYLDPADLTHITAAAPAGVEGAGAAATNGTCESSRAYLCNVTDSLSEGYGYNGPTGLGTPNGSLGPFTAPAGVVVSVANPGDYALQTGVSYRLPAIQAMQDLVEETLTYSATGLPAGLSIDSATGVISGMVSSAVTDTVHVTVKDVIGASSTVSFRITVVPSLRSAYHPAAGPVTLNAYGKCLDDTANQSANGTKVEIWHCNSLASQKWTFSPDTDPGHAGAGTMQIHGKCLDISNRGTANGSKIQLWACNGGTNQQWEIASQYGELVNPQSGRCLDDTGRSITDGTQVEIWDCNGGINQNWLLPPSPFDNGVSGKCLDDTANQSADGTKVESWTCNGLASQRWQVYPDGTIRIHGKCLNAVNHATTIGTKIQLYSCYQGNSAIHWYLTAWGQIENAEAQKCLVIPGNSSANGAPIELSDCNVQPSEVWAAS